MLQDKFLQNLVDNGTTIYVYLTSGIKLIGKLISFDSRTINIINSSSSQLVYKEAIATIVTSKEK